MNKPLPPQKALVELVITAIVISCISLVISGLTILRRKLP